ncbi:MULTISPECIES: GNAT family N-acetyltransferase [Kocuria]|jgi:ribosomal protein S18 acetylase RimI-like enzyme|uniref:GNAT family N-acetyltransferase n=1 Tax=Kocuria TaxID=57493 RepID=UPI00203C7955|nr:MULTISPECIES: GNAT family N-acetyltransferase [Kocuria]MCM3688179.1 GNAT family N-acetyltransferase [Kocuria rosea]HST72134.1 GNAT family N-acetyltransferase [Kocuria rosea]
MTGTITLIAQTTENPKAHPVPTRPAAPEDAEGLAQLYYSSYEQGGVSSLEEAREVIKGVFAGEYGPFLPDASPVVVDEDGTIVAAALVLARRVGDDLPDAPYIFELFTAASRRRQGLAEQLVRSSMATLYKNGYEQVCLRIAEDNAAALALYLTLDFNRWIPDGDYY